MKVFLFLIVSLVLIPCFSLAQLKIVNQIPLRSNSVISSFTAPDTVCLNAPVVIKNTSVGVSTNYWNFCVADVNTPPLGQNLGNTGNLLDKPVFIDYVFDGTNYYGFLTNNFPGKLIRLQFGNSLLNNPTADDLGNLGAIPDAAEGLQIIKNEDKWYVIVIGGSNNLPSASSRIVKVEFGNSLANNSPVATNWGNLGNLDYPVDLHIFNENGNWYGFTVNSLNNTITRFDFTNSFNNAPTAINLGNLGNMNFPTGVYALNDNGSWSVFVANEGSSTLTRLDFGGSLLNTPVGINIGNPGGNLNQPRDVTIIKYCGQIIAFVTNAANDIVKMNFSSITSIPTTNSIGNIGNLDFPHSLSKLFRMQNDFYSFVTNVNNNTITRLKFSGCSSASFPNSTLQDPPAVSYSIPGTYNINLATDDGLPTQNAFCKQVVVLPGPPHLSLQNISICTGDSIKIGAVTRTNNQIWNTGQQTDSIYVKDAGIFWLESHVQTCYNRDTFAISIKPLPVVRLGNDTTLCSSADLQLDAGNPGSIYLWQNGETKQTIKAKDSGIYYVKVAKDLCVSSDSIRINYYANPDVKILGDTAVCQGQSIELKTTANGTYTYSWSPSTGLNSPNSSNPIATPIKDTKYILAVSNQNCSLLDTVTISVNKKPQLNIRTTDKICKGDTVYLNAGNVGAGYTWQDGSNQQYFMVIDSGTYNVTVTDYNNCSSSDTVKIKVFPKPIIHAVKSNDIDCVVPTSQLFVSGGLNYVWTPQKGLSDPLIYNPLSYPDSSTTYIVSGENEFGCISSDSIRLFVTHSGKFLSLLPNAFTPDNNGKNDCFGIKNWGRVTNLKFSIFDRWGKVIFFTNDQNACWDGSYNGTPQPGGVFVYLINAETICGKVMVKGIVTLIR